MANKHFGNLADVFKHLALGEILATLQPSEYWESHAGNASYHETAEIAPERHHGAHFFLAAAAQSPTLRGTTYLRLLAKGIDNGKLLRLCGSPLLAHQFLSDRTRRFLFCDTDAASLQSIRNLGGDLQKVDCVQDDGIMVLRGATVLLPDAWTATTLAFIDPYDPFAPSDAGISSLEFWCELANRGIRSVLFYSYANAAERAACQQKMQQALEKARLLQRGVQRFEGALRSQPPAPPTPAGTHTMHASPATQWGFGLLTLHIEGAALERVDAALRGLEKLYEAAPFPADAAPGTGAWSYLRAWM